MPQTVVLKDGTNNGFNARTNLYPDGTQAFYHASDQATVTDDAVSMVGTTMSKFSDGFSGPTIAAGSATLTSISDNWNVVRNTGGMGIQQTNGSLVITPGTAVAELLLIGKTQVSIPANLVAVLSMTARVASQETRIGYLEVDSTGALVPNPNLANFPNNFCCILWDGTSSSTVKLETLSGGHTSSQQAAASNQSSSTGTLEYALEARPEDISYAQLAANSISSRSTSGARISTMVPSPMRRYAPFIWIRNVATTTANTITLQRIISMDIQELQAEIGGGRGNSIASQAIPVIVTSTATANISNVAASTSSNGLSSHRLHSAAASTNATSVKTTAGKLYAGVITNNSATVEYFKLFNKTSVPALGTDTPALTIPVFPNSNVFISDVVGIYGMSFSAGIAYAITSNLADTDATAIAAGAFSVHLLYA